MRTLGIVLIVTLVASAAKAESTRSAMQEFGLLGTWSIDCSIDVKQGCGASRRCFGRVTYAASLWGAATREIVVPSLTGNEPSRFTVEITSASRVTADKIRIVYKAIGEPSGRAAYISPRVGEEWETILLKSGDKLKGWVSQRTDGGKISILNGEDMQPNPSWSLEQGPVKQWVSTGTSPALLERCTN
jgi:hypothetical protein